MRFELRTEVNNGGNQLSWCRPDLSRRHVGEPLRTDERVSFKTSTGPTRASYLSDFETTLRALVDRLDRGSTVAELGAGANPNLAAHPRVAAKDVQLVMIDISQDELAKAPDVGRKLCLDVASPDFPLEDTVDLACSQMLAEHVRDGGQFLRNVARMLKPSGLYLQVSPVLYALPFVVNRIVPERLSSPLLNMFQPRDLDRRGKFPARYSLCRGPRPKQLARIEQAGLRVVAARGYFGHNYYGRIPVLRELEVLKAKALVRRPIPLLCSFSVYLLTRQSD